MSLKLAKLLFPQLADKYWNYINLDEESRASGLRDEGLMKYISDKYAGINSGYGLEFIYGGYFEDRWHLHQGQYMTRPKGAVVARPTFHLGVDFWVPAGTEVFLPVDVRELLFSGMDADLDGGWGGRTIFELLSGDSLILGHLDGIVLNKLGEKISAGTKVAVIGPPETNGGWVPHLHIQVCDPKIDPVKADGYGYLTEMMHLDYPRPESILGEE